MVATIITNAIDLSNTETPDVRYRIEGVVTFTERIYPGVFAVDDWNGGAAFLINETSNPKCRIHPGDIIRASGRTAIGTNKTIRRNCTAIEVLGKTEPPAPIPTSVKDLADGKMDNRFVKVEATLRDVFPDKIDPTVVFFVLQDGGDTTVCHWPSDAANVSHLRSIVGARVEATGVCTSYQGGHRVLGGRTLRMNGVDDIKILQPPPKDEFDLPGIVGLRKLDPSRVAQAGRCRANGTVIATWGRNKLLIKNNWSELTDVELDTDNLPPCMTMIEVAGLPASDLYRIKLLRAKWRKALGPPLKTEPAEDVKVKALFADKHDRLRYDSLWHGRTIRIRGTVKAMTSGDYTDGRFFLESDSFMLPVDTTPAPTAIKLVKVGYQVEVTGVCIMEGENWSPYSAFPQIHGVLLVVRTPDDIHVIDRPSWWTARRLLAALAILLIILGGILFWNIQLRKAVRKREIELKQEIFNHVNSDMKIRERNNLSIELHDSLSQGLTGVSMEIDTARRLTDDPAGITRHLKLAARSLKSCRDELKACIHDLRTNTLGDCDMDESIRRTLVPFISDTELSIRFNVPRNLISDNIAHNVLRIIRELVVNAVRHGQASSVKIAGSIAGQTLCFSVQDNGCGFDPTTCPGPDQGHFGLQGIRERLKRLNGSLTIGSKGINGTRAAVIIELQTERSEQQ